MKTLQDSAHLFCLREELEIMISYELINVMYLKMKRIRLLLNYLNLIMNVHASIESFYFIFLLKGSVLFQ